jgi:hypothetical protein
VDNPAAWQVFGAPADLTLAIADSEAAAHDPDLLSVVAFQMAVALLPAGVQEHFAVFRPRDCAVV